MINIAIVDDSHEACELIHDSVTNFFQKKALEYRTFIFNNSEHLLSDSGTYFNIILLDIDMPGLNGLEAAKLLRQNAVGSIIIFITNEIKYMEHAFGLNVFSFVLKDKLETLLPEVLERCILEIDSNVFYNYKTNNGIITIQRNTIIYALMEQRKVSLYTTHGEYTINFTTLNDFYETIKGHENFIYVNRSTIVNLVFVARITNNKSIVLRGVQTPIQISKDKTKDVTNALINWISKRSLI